MMSTDGIDIDLRLGQSLLSLDLMAALGDALGELAPKWFSSICIVVGKERTPIDMNEPNAFVKAVVQRMLSRSPTIRDWFEQQFGKRPWPSRVVGSAELGSRDPSLTVVVRADSLVFAPVVDKFLWANSIAFQIRRSQVEGMNAVDWARSAFRRMCERFSPWHAMAHVRDEYDHKNALTENGYEAVGNDASKELPGLYWLNFFGKPYCELMGYERLMTAPAKDVQQVDDGVLVEVHGNPVEWNTFAYRRSVDRVMEHLGPEYFFLKDEPNRKTVAPPFELPRLPKRS